MMTNIGLARNLMIDKPIFQKFKSTDKQLYKQSIDLRNAVLRGPLKRFITPKEMIIEQNNQFYGITIADTLVTTFSSYQKDKTTVQLVSFAVSAEYQRQGFGTHLLRWAIADFRKQGYQRVSLSARASAHDFYLKQGFKDTGKPKLNSYLNVMDFDMQYTLLSQNCINKSYAKILFF